MWSGMEETPLKWEEIMQLSLGNALGIKWQRWNLHEFGKAFICISAKAAPMVALFISDN